MMATTDHLTEAGRMALHQPPSIRDLFEQEYEDQVRRAGLILCDVDAAQDIVQAVFVKMAERWSRIEQPGHYLSRSVLNGCRNEFRRRSRITLFRDPPDPPLTTPEHRMFDVLGKLPLNERAAIVLRFYSDESYQEIAQQLGCSEGSVGPWINRGLNRMRGMLNEESY